MKNNGSSAILVAKSHVFPPEKDETDLEIALKWTVQQGYQSMRVIGALGRRIDQTFGNIYLLALPELTPLDVRFVSADQQLWLARPGQFTIEGLAGDTVSLIPIGGDTVNIQTEGLHYPLINETLFMGPARGISNVLDAECATISFETGLLLVVHTIGRAE
jgi:thiamine pyrophosphokinase